jgi:hypothetical protein
MPTFLDFVDVSVDGSPGYPCVTCQIDTPGSPYAARILAGEIVRSTIGSQFRLYGVWIDQQRDPSVVSVSAALIARFETGLLQNIGTPDEPA